MRYLLTSAAVASTRVRRVAALQGATKPRTARTERAREEAAMRVQLAKLALLRAAVALIAGGMMGEDGGEPKGRTTSTPTTHARRLDSDCCCFCCCNLRLMGVTPREPC